MGNTKFLLNEEALRINFFLLCRFARDQKSVTIIGFLKKLVGQQSFGMLRLTD